ncbi:DUF429 domain-containing protein [Engelhardtia mirabilis]|uniref:Methylated-DNA--protein-cysteine methyltransferase n=1 Tax=Engelhardtia mirabilis TaxID=2528011 RepID=A0A518BHX2_9BACT|nr:Methylated-DNA--protein-cysteine methyltransferase [Planctomycetes bacterium Pla133]QDV00898.1 Methylated-DNA--protein-cysteine methyltransferase [Planctomycetes bacterium Pla86]
MKRLRRFPRGPWTGVDGCRAGWVRARLSPAGRIEIDLVKSARALIADPADPLVIDMPIGLFPGGRARARDCDRAARERLGPRRSSVFNPPTRAMLRAREHGEVGRLGLSIQAFHLIPKIAELDRALSADDASRVLEGHPELAFACLAGAPLEAPKRTTAGRHARARLLEAAVAGSLDAFADFAAATRRKDVALDDILDAMVLAVAARDVAAGTALRLPEGELDRDRRGLPMQIFGASSVPTPVDDQRTRIDTLRPFGMARRPAVRGQTDERRARVLATVDAIPSGKVATYGLVATEAGLPRRARFVGGCLRDLPPGTSLPWWRVVNASGGISPRGDGSSTGEQRRRLEREGVQLTGGGRVDLSLHLWRP